MNLKMILHIQETGLGADKRGRWKITGLDKLEMTFTPKGDYRMEAKLREISSDQFEMTHPNKTKYIFSRVK